jgi:hypothetical protein
VVTYHGINYYPVRHDFLNQSIKILNNDDEFKLKSLFISKVSKVICNSHKLKLLVPLKMAQFSEPPPEIQANDVDYVNRIEACHNTPLIDPGQIPLKFSEYSFRSDQHILVVRDDYLCGGSKSRMAFDFIRDQVQKGYQHLVLKLPFLGFFKSYRRNTRFLSNAPLLLTNIP